MVFIKLRSIPNVSCSTFATGARQLVVQDALEMTWCREGSYIDSLTPSTMVRSSPLAGAEMMTFLTLPRRCAAAFSASVKWPVDSITRSTPRSPQGIGDGVPIDDERSGSRFNLAGETAIGGIIF